MRVSCVLVALCFAVLSPATYAKSSLKIASEECSNRTLRQMLASGHPSANKLERILGCLGRRADPLLAASAAYQIALHLAGADGTQPADFREAARRAHTSADYL